MRKNILLGLGLGVVLIGISVPAQSLGEAQKPPQREFRDEGRNPIPFSVICTTFTWTVVSSSDAIRRGIIFEAIAANQFSTCIATTTNNADPCGDTTPGHEMASNSSLTDYSTAQWTCKSRPQSSTTTIKGVNYRDKGDYGSTSAPSYQ
jgi:hypothetical protein